MDFCCGRADRATFVCCGGRFLPHEAHCNESCMSTSPNRRRSLIHGVVTACRRLLDCSEHRGIPDAGCHVVASPIARIDFRDEANNRAAGSIFRGILLQCSDNSLTVDSSAFRTFFRPPKLPDIRTLFAILSDQTSTLHSALLHRGCSAEGIVAPQRRQILDKCLGKLRLSLGGLAGR